MDDSKTTPKSTTSEPFERGAAIVSAASTADGGVVDANGAGRLSIKYLSDKLEDAEMLLGYAAETGIEVDDAVRRGILTARAAIDSDGLTVPVADNLITAFTKLADKVKPVTVESLRLWSQQRDQSQTEFDRTPRGRLIRRLSEIGALGWTAILSGLVIMFFSVLTFVSSKLSEKISNDIDSANALISRLRVELGPADASSVTNLPPEIMNNPAVSPQDRIWFGPNGVPPNLTAKDVISDLQQFAAAMRQIHGYSRQLSHFLPFFSDSWYTLRATNLELTAGLNVRLSQELTDRVADYQKVRGFANQVIERVNVYYGAIGTCILPVLYALLGTVVYLLRLHEDQIRRRILIVREKYAARLLIAGISGLTVGQFNSIAQGISLSPFALAFLAGYAVDVYFTFLEGLLQMFRRGSGSR
jgi:hypothetical protein